MPRTRKTYPLRKLVERANRITSNPNITPEARNAVFYLVQGILMDAGAYRGFQYCDWDEWGFEAWRMDGEPECKDHYLGDETRRYLYFRE